MQCDIFPVSKVSTYLRSN